MPRTPRTAKKGAGASKGTSVSTRPAWPDRFLVELRKYGTITATAQAVNVGRRTVYDELARNPDFAKDVQDVQSECVELIEATLYQAALNPDNTTDRIFFLKTRKPEVYGDKLRQDQIDQIKREARQETLGELEDEIAALTPEARRVVLAAFQALRKSTNPEELTP